MWKWGELNAKACDTGKPSVKGKELAAPPGCLPHKHDPTLATGPVMP